MRCSLLGRLSGRGGGTGRRGGLKIRCRHWRLVGSNPTPGTSFVSDTGLESPSALAGLPAAARSRRSPTPAPLAMRPSCSGRSFNSLQPLVTVRAAGVGERLACLGHKLPVVACAAQRQLEDAERIGVAGLAVGLDVGERAEA